MLSPDLSQLGKPNTSPAGLADPTISALNTGIGGSGQRGGHLLDYNFASR
jgi:hypothetical protein